MAETTDLQPTDFEVYLRFNEDPDKDYGFQINKTTTFAELHRIFKTLPISLRPSIFYDTEPTRFGYLVAPGFLTADGNILFNYNLDHVRFQRFPKSQLDPILNYVWPGQLILPEWRFDHVRHLLFIGYLLAWLYLDLPDFISPTPGNCPTNLFIKALAWLAKTATGSDNYPMIQNLLAETEVGSFSKMGQICFFVFHVLKIVVIYLCFYVGIVNPVESGFTQIITSRLQYFIMHGLFNQQDKKYGDLSPELLMAIGWTGARKQTIDVYRDNYRKAVIDGNGGIVKAHQNGVLNNINKRLGVFLNRNEGFGTPLEDSSEKDKYPLSLITVAEYPEFVAETIKKLEEDKSEPFVEPEEELKDIFQFGDESGAFKLSYKYFGLYNVAFLYYSGLLESESYKGKYYRFNSEPEVRAFRSHGSYKIYLKSWKKYFNKRAKLGDYLKGESEGEE